MKQVAFLLILVSFALSCKKGKIENPVEVPKDDNQEELITTFLLDLSDTTGNTPNIRASFQDLDGPGGASPTKFDTIRLKKNVVYNGTITLLNESVSPAENITDEVKNEAEEHLFCYQISQLSGLTINRTDSDGNYEIGISTIWISGSTAEIGKVKITLKHQPGIKNGDCDPGETDIELEFVVKIED